MVLSHNCSNFNSYRRWFNALYGLSFDGKFKGLSTLLSTYGSRFVELLSYKLYKSMYPRSSHARTTALFDSVLVFHVNGHIVKLYPR